MYHATVNGKKKLDIEWNGHSAEGSMDGKLFKADVLKTGENTYHWVYNNRSYTIEIVRLDHETKEGSVKVNGRSYSLQLKDRFDDLLKSLGMEGGAGARLQNLKAPMPGLVLDILVSEGQEVEKDSPLLILEAMKMENVIKCPAPGKVKKVTAVKGSAVEKNAVLIEFA